MAGGRTCGQVYKDKKREYKNEQSNLYIYREDDVYLPPDTPTVNPGPNTLSLIHKKKTLLKHRCIARLKSYHYKQLEIIRKNVASTVQKEKLPCQSFTPPIEVITGRDYLAYFTQDILDCIDHLDKVKRDEIDPSKDPKVVQVNNGELFHEKTEYTSQLEVCLYILLSCINIAFYL